MQLTFVCQHGKLFLYPVPVREGHRSILNEPYIRVETGAGHQAFSGVHLDLADTLGGGGRAALCSLEYRKYKVHSSIVLPLSLKICSRPLECNHIAFQLYLGKVLFGNLVSFQSDSASYPLVTAENC